MKTLALSGKSYAGNLRVWFDKGKSHHIPRSCGSFAYDLKTVKTMVTTAVTAMALAATAELPTAYVETTGTQAFLTDVYVGPKTKIVADMQVTANASGYYFGAVSTEASCCCYRFWDGTFAFGMNNGAVVSGSIGLSINTSLRVLVTLNGATGACAIDNRETGESLKTGKVGGTRTKTSTRPLGLAANNATSGLSTFAKMKIFSFRIYEDGKLVRCYVPYWNADKSVVGLMDLYYGNVLENAGSEALTVGGTVSSKLLDYADEMPEGVIYDATTGKCMSEMSLQVKDGGLFTVDGGEATALARFQKDASATVVVRPVPEAGYEFYKWTGDMEKLEVAQDGTIVLRGACPRSLVCYFRKVGTTGVERSWTGAGDGKSWSDAANWDPAGVPAEDDVVSIGPGATVLVSESTKNLYSLTLSSTLMMSNWTTRLNADYVYVNANGVIKPSNAFADTEMSNRVWIACRDLSVASGGKINADKLGYKGKNGPGWGDIASRDSYDFAGSYGGKASDGKATQCYGSVEEPTDPGTGSGKATGSAGGAIRIDASRAVRIDGVVSANGIESTLWAQSASSGGSVYLSCSTVSGKGSVQACSPDKVSTEGHYGGGGGRIAVHYDAQAQSGVSCDVRFDAHGGMGYYAVPEGAMTGYTAQLKSPFRVGGLGSLWFTDNQFLAKNVWRYSGVWHSGAGTPSGLTLAHNLKLDSSCVQFDDMLTKVEIQGDLEIVGSYAHSSGFEVSNAKVVVKGNVVLNGGRIRLNYSDMDIEGNFTMTGTGNDYNGSQFVIYAAATNGQERTWGSEVNVGGTWTMEKYAQVFPHAHSTDGAVPYFTAKNLTMLSGTRIDASQYGYAAGKGPGGATDRGASHGGRGGGAKVGKEPYDSYKNPMEPGSGGTLAGGGAIIFKTENHMQIDGALLAQGNIARGDWQYGSSGGTIHLFTKKFTSETGTLNVRGGSGGTVFRGGGGGGRIAVWASRFVNTNATIKISGGDNATDGKDTYLAEPGTIFWGQWSKGLMLFVK